MAGENPPSKRDLLRARLLDIAEAQIADGGIVALKARELASGAGCALGAIYSAYSDLGELAVAVNRRTVDHLTAHLKSAISGLKKETPDDILATLALAYLDYAETHGGRWRTLFSVGIPETADGPGFAEATAPVAALFGKQLAALHPSRSKGKTDTAARTMLAAVHGVVALGAEPRLAALPRRKLENRITRLTQTLAAQADNF